MKATKSDIANFIERLCANGFYPPRHENEAAEAEWAAGVASALTHYETDILPQIAQEILDTRIDRKFPLPAEIRKVSLEVYDRVRSSQLLPEAPKGRDAEWTAERLALADSLCRTELGRRAAREDWILGMWDFCRKNSRMPDAREVERIITESREADAFIDDAYRDAHRSQLHRIVAGTADAIRAKRAEKRAMVLGQNHA